MSVKDELKEAIRIQKSILNEWAFWIDADKAAEYIRKRESGIAALEREIADARRRHEEAPRRVTACRRQLKKLHAKLKEMEHAAEIERLKEMMRFQREYEREKNSQKSQPTG